MVFLCSRQHKASLKAKKLDIFETPVTVTPQKQISKTLNSSKIPLKYLAFTFGERTFTFGERVLLGIIRVLGILGNFFFVAGGFWDSVGRGAP